MADAPTTAQLRDNIDRGLTGEKVGFQDPAAAPLGTDDEAAGQAPTAQERRLAAKTQPRLQEPRPVNAPLLYAALIFAAAVVIVAITYLGG